MFYHIKNHSSSQAYGPGPAPWDFTPANPVPSFEDKEAYRKWCLAPSTNHYFFTTYEAVNAAMRITEDNPAFRMCGVVADFDSPVSESDWASLMTRASADFPPAYGSATFSGNARVVWLFETPAFVYDTDAHQKFLKLVAKELKINKLLPGFDEGAYLKPALTFELGRDWRKLSDSVIRSATVHHWLYEAGNKATWNKGGEIVVPLDRVRAAMQERFPGRWQGEFELGSQGIRFWDPTADNTTAAIVRETGMQTFTGGKPFVTWREIFGHRFVEEYQEDRVALATQGVFYDGKHYWVEEHNHWQYKTKDDMTLAFKVDAGLRAERMGRETASEVERALYHIQHRQRVEAALPLVHQPQGVSIRAGGERVLNTSSREVLSPAEGKQTWGENFPFIARYLDHFFSPKEPQLNRYLAWLKRFYQSSYERNIQKGHALFFAGPANRGKTLMSTVLIGDLVGGHFDAGSVLLGETTFNSSAFNHALWTVDDGSSNVDYKTHAKFSSNVKKLTANQSFEFSQKFRDSALINWRGRIVVTLNDDPDSLRMLIDAEMSTLDKVMFFKMSKDPFIFPPDAGSVIRAELPYFARWLLDWEVPVDCIGDNRFGVVEYHAPELLAEARQGGRTSEFRELLDSFRKSYFEVNDVPHWEGTSMELMLLMNMDPPLAEVIRQQRITPSNMRRELQKIASLGYAIESRHDERGNIIWRIPREEVATRQLSAA